MKFIFFHSPEPIDALPAGTQPSSNSSKIGQESLPFLAELAKLEKHHSTEQQRQDLQKFFQLIEQQSSPEKSKKFLQKLSEWDLNHQVEAMRTAGASEKEDLDNYLDKHGKLSSAFLILENKKNQPLSFKVDFHGNNLAEWRVGMGDLLSPQILKVKLIQADGKEVIGIRAQNPKTRRIGYYNEALLAQGKFDYLAIHTGDNIQILETTNISPQGSPRTLKDHLEIYKPPLDPDHLGQHFISAASAYSLEPEETRYDPLTGEVFPDANTAFLSRRADIVTASKSKRKSSDELSQKPSQPSSPEYSSSGEVAHHYTRNINQIADDHAFNVQHLQIPPATKKQLIRFKSTVLSNRDRYERVAEQTDIPWQLIASLHFMESGGKFNCYLHNGDPLGQPTVHVPRGKFFQTWEESAIDALNGQSRVKNKLGITRQTIDLAPMLAFAESYNGLGYRKEGRGPSAYIYGGTNIYRGGRYVADGKFDPDNWYKGQGVAARLSVLQETGQAIS